MKKKKKQQQQLQNKHKEKQKTRIYTLQKRVLCENGLFVAERSHGIKSPNWIANDTLGHG